MSDTPYDWKEAQAHQLEFLAAELGKALMEAENAEEILELRQDQAGLDVVRAFTATLRSQINGMAGEARDLRSGPPGAVLPLTSRHIRP